MGPDRPAEVAVVGGGLVGSLLALFLVHRGLAVTVHEARPDPRRTDQVGGRSINLVVTSRGIHALRRVGLETAVRRLTVPVMGRMVHAADGRLAFQPYGRDDTECNHSVSRAELNAFLLDAAERAGARLRFGSRLVAAELGAGPCRLRLKDETLGAEREVETPVVIGADGAGSVVRSELAKLPGHGQRVELLEHGYKELAIPAGAGGTFRIERRALHVWPRGRSMLMALPNRDGSFTVTLYLPHRGRDSFESLDDAPKLLELFASNFPDALPLIPDLAVSFFANPTGELGTVRCQPWHHRGRALLIGDAAHAIVPFFGQGMNCGFEDCTVLDRMLERDGHADWESVFAEFDGTRKRDTDAIADMALENFVEMRDRVGDPRFLLRKEVEHVLERELPLEYRSRYSMVMYSEIPYAVCQQAGRIQQELLDELCAGLELADELDLGRATRLIRDRLTPYLAGQAVSLDY